MSLSGLSGHEKKLDFNLAEKIEKYSKKKKDADTIYAKVGSNLVCYIIYKQALEEVSYSG